VLEQFTNAFFSQVEQMVHLLAREGHALSRALNFNKVAVRRHDDIHVRVAARVFCVLEVQQWQPI